MKKKLVRYIIDDFNLLVAFEEGHSLSFLLDGQLFCNNFVQGYKIEGKYLKETGMELVEYSPKLAYGYYRIKDISSMSLIPSEYSYTTIASLRKDCEGMLLVYNIKEVE